MKILLTHGYFLAEDPAERVINKPYPPLGLLYLSAYLKCRGVVPDVFDSTFVDPAELQKYIRTSRPDLVGFYANMMTRRFVLPMVALCKELGIKVVLGGPDPANYAQQYLSAGADVVVIGEGEQTLLELIDHYRAENSAPDQIDGVQFLDRHGHLQSTEPREKIKKLDDLPFPDRAAIDIPRYMDTWKRHHGASSVSLITARGCPYTCRWCSHAVYGFSYRSRSPENVADEVALIRETYDPDQLWYADDVFTINKKWIAAYAEELGRRNLHIPFETISREDRLDDDTIRHLSTMRCHRLWVGAESGSQAVLDAMDRRTSAQRTREVIAKLQRVNIRAGTFIMFGYPGEGWRELNETFDHLRTSLPDDILTTAAYPIKGTPFYEEIDDRVIARESWTESSDRDLLIDGAKTHLFYDFAGKWMQAGVQLQREKNEISPSWRILLKTWVRMMLGRIAMYATWRLAIRR